MKNGFLRERRGATILELIAYFAGLAIVLNVCGMTFVRTNRLSALTSAALLQQRAVDAFSLDATQAVHGASRIVSEAGGFKTGTQQVVLETEPGYTVLGGSQGKLARWTLLREGDAVRVDTVHTYPFLAGDLDITYDAEDLEKARRITLRLIPKGADAVKARESREIVVSLRAAGVSR